jgi:hypothetical protein
MHTGYVLCTPDSQKVLCISADKKGVELLELKDSKGLNRALCLPDLTSLKNVYERFKKLGLVENLDIVNIAKLYKHSY